MKRTVVVAGALLLGVGAVWRSRIWSSRTQTVMKANGKNAGAWPRWSRAKSPTIRPPSTRRWTQFEDTAKKLPTLFPEAPRV